MSKTTVFTIGFTQKTAEQFFELVISHGINLMADIRLNNSSQLAGFSKGGDLRYFLSEIAGCAYAHRPDLAPTKEIRESYKNKKITWAQYEIQYLSLIRERDAIYNFMEEYGGYENICLLCSEPSADYCHRRLLAEMLAEKFSGLSVRHI
jgi:uncharacterized protein (DUF488 family)